MRKILPVIALVVVFSIVLAVPAFAASSGWTEIEVTNEGYANVIWFNDEMDGLPLYPVASSGSGNLEWKINAISGETVLRLFFRPTDKVFPLKQGDVVKMPFIYGGFGGWFGGASNAMEMYWTVIDSNNIVSSYSFNEVAVGGRAYRKIFPSGGISWNYTPPEEIIFTATKDCSTACLGLVVEFTVSQNFAFSMNQKSFTIGYGNLNSPEAPIYLKPDSKPFDDYTDLEGDILDSTGAGMSGASDILGGFASGITGFVGGMQFVTRLMSSCITRVPVLGVLVQLSLALGIFAFVVGMASLAVGAADRRKEKVSDGRKVRQDAVSIKRDGIASHRPSRGKK